MIGKSAQWDILKESKRGVRFFLNMINTCMEFSVVILYIFKNKTPSFTVTTFEFTLI